MMRIGNSDETDFWWCSFLRCFTLYTNDFSWLLKMRSTIVCCWEVSCVQCFLLVWVLIQCGAYWSFHARFHKKFPFQFRLATQHSMHMANTSCYADFGATRPKLLTWLRCKQLRGRSVCVCPSVVLKRTDTELSQSWKAEVSAHPLINLCRDFLTVIKAQVSFPLQSLMSAFIISILMAIFAVGQPCGTRTTKLLSSPQNKGFAMMVTLHKDRVCRPLDDSLRADNRRTSRSNISQKYLHSMADDHIRPAQPSDLLERYPVWSRPDQFFNALRCDIVSFPFLRAACKVLRTRLAVVCQWFRPSLVVVSVSVFGTLQTAARNSCCYSVWNLPIIHS